MEPGGLLGQDPAGFGGRLVRGAAGAGVEYGPVLQRADEGAHAFLDGFRPPVGVGMCLCRLAVVGRAAGGAAEERLRGTSDALRCSQPPPEGGDEAEDDEDDHHEPDRATGCGPRGSVEEVAHPGPETVDGAFEEVRVVLVVHRVGQLVLGRLPGGEAWDVQGRPVPRADEPCRCCGAPRCQHRISS